MLGWVQAVRSPSEIPRASSQLSYVIKALKTIDQHGARALDTCAPRPEGLQRGFSTQHARDRLGRGRMRQLVPGSTRLQHNALACGPDLGLSGKGLSPVRFGSERQGIEFAGRSHTRTRVCICLPSVPNLGCALHDDEVLAPRRSFTAKARPEKPAPMIATSTWWGGGSEGIAFITSFGVTVWKREVDLRQLCATPWPASQ